MFYEPAEGHGLRHDPIKTLIAPRPIGWISTVDADGRANLAPYSFFNLVSEQPTIVMFSSRGPKDTVSNVMATGEFVCNLASYALRRAVNMTSTAALRGVSEFGLAGLTPAASVKVRPPRVGEAPAALECVHLETIALKGRDGRASPYLMVLGEVVGVHIDERVVVDGVVDPARLQPIARLGGPDYSVVDEAALFRMTRPAG
jgi:flavin reductase (DIM6/NTAB) family NADH-FMN oxidoreductase RutF